MGRKYNTRLIRADYSYHVEQVADLFDIDIATVRRWMRGNGLQRIPNTRPHLIHSSQLKAFMEKQKAARKKFCATYEVFCFRCQSSRIPQQGSGTVTQLPNKSIRVNATCGLCECKVFKTIKQAEWGQDHPLAAYLSDAPREHKGVPPTHRICPLQQEYAP